MSWDPSLSLLFSEKSLCTKTDVTLRRIQRFKILPGEEILWSFGKEKGCVKADEKGLVTLPGLTLTGGETVLTLTRM